MTEWEFAEKRKELIEMVKKFARLGNAEAMATDIVDAILVAWWDFEHLRNEERLQGGKG